MHPIFHNINRSGLQDVQVWRRSDVLDRNSVQGVAEDPRLYQYSQIQNAFLIVFDFHTIQLLSPHSGEASATFSRRWLSGMKQMTLPNHQRTMHWNGPCWLTKTQAGWGQCWTVFLFHVFPNIFIKKNSLTPPQLGPGVLALGDTEVKPEETEVIAPIPQDAKAQLAKLGFPEAEGDVASSAMIPKACASIHKHLAKLDAVLSGYNSDSLSALQVRNLTLIMM